MMNDYNTVARRMHIQLDGIRPELERAQERWQRVLGKIVVSTAMGDALRTAVLGSWDQ
jgi:hypothetical protein